VAEPFLLFTASNNARMRENERKAVGSNDGGTLCQRRRWHSWRFTCAYMYQARNAGEAELSEPQRVVPTHGDGRGPLKRGGVVVVGGVF
jgi:hypothetical protein